MWDVNGTEFLLLIVIAVVVLGPERLPEYAAKLGQLVRQAKAYAEGAKTSLRDQMGPDFDDIDWRQYDPRQYDPRRIVREALLDDGPSGSTVATAGAGAGAAAAGGAAMASAQAEPEPIRPGQRYDQTYTPFDAEAT
ncbi:twin-arginine translocase TatA/TatE family subunit [Arsenicicoccus bolidensis]|uniref:Twin-arginine translocase TatA/TatE family subunit n=1 Tax=Arsenicicoccus bolidensis TaxID=229480 RepID=A0ABS9Q0S4_9MICO|nr:twin-arginine translocase TatA/TatE family subunit [Arsenicicoccus bolidensis]MCG7321482.1 twin-arginine translocase TatA/TatE family subunit [Arsenicicoccus bolidensis]